MKGYDSNITFRQVSKSNLGTFNGDISDVSGAQYCRCIILGIYWESAIDLSFVDKQTALVGMVGRMLVKH